MRVCACVRVRVCARTFVWRGRRGGLVVHESQMFIAQVEEFEDTLGIQLIPGKSFFFLSPLFGAPVICTQILVVFVISMVSVIAVHPALNSLFVAV